MEFKLQPSLNNHGFQTPNQLEDSWNSDLAWLEESKVSNYDSARQVMDLVSDPTRGDIYFYVRLEKP